MKRSRITIYIICIVLLFPALLIHLGLMPFIGDESIRAMVALEMILSDDYITPTLGGIYYLNKPPVYNWILAAFFHLAGNFSEFTARIPTVLALLAYTLTIYWFIKKHFSHKMAFVVALSFVTCGRMLIYDSMLALIDTTYSWLTYTMFMLVYFFYTKRKYSLLFIAAYTISAITFLMKGLPSIVFLIATLVAFLFTERNLRILFSYKHLIGIVVFFAITGGFYAIYTSQNTGMLHDALMTILSESTKKSAVGTGTSETILHLFTFPFEMTYHFIPWSLLIIYFIHKRIFKDILEHDFIRYCAVVFLANIAVYWLSPVTYPRYLLMLAPLIFTVFVYLHYKHAKKNSLHTKIIETGFLIIMIVMNLGIIVFPFHPQTSVIQYAIPKTIILFVALTLIIVGYYKLKSMRMVFLIMFLLTFRIVFNVFILEARHDEAWDVQMRKNAIQFAQKTKEKQLYLYGNPPNIYREGKNYFSNRPMFYITRERRKILRMDSTHKPNALYIINNGDLDKLKRSHIIYDTLVTHPEKTDYKIIRFP